ncbi:alpha-keto acid decarboxylase family protein [Lactobacillus sp. Sy-1]|uniref:alpha-keto acid decarboxylase family protein n=1 Tax=Lactobacillus sp. Sy-1 TaxID=2109645 RepID=UPI001C5BBA34|nr:thiamine pyrophosphate-binding protein [Lactobacillus sp. Sy-1]MBW1606351.1 alpha-keto acid decarboxylase family protein [Lactobacillus sp. Sy-1]
MYTVSDYLVDVIKEMGASNVFGVPGDYNLDFLDHITHRDDVKWTGNANELNASYMADGYARKNGFAAFVTTFGVGELSAINGLAGSVTENVPVLEIVGAPSMNSQSHHEIVHHTFGDGNYVRFTNAHKQLGVKVVSLTDQRPIDQINDAISYIVKYRKPVYMTLPINVGKMPVNETIKTEIKLVIADNDANYSQSLMNDLKTQVNNAKQPLVILGHEVINMQLSGLVEQFIKQNNLLFSDIGLGKDAVDESLAQFIGTYDGLISDQDINNVVDASDLIILIGVKLGDMVTGLFTQSFDETKTININNQDATVFGQAKDYLANYNFAANVKQLSQLSLNKCDNAGNNRFEQIATPVASDNALTQNFYDQAVASFIKSGDTLVTEQGTSFSGLVPFTLPKDTQFIAQPLWGSIGYAFPAAIGSQIADPSHRTILSTGEGSLQLTIQEFGMAFREKIHPIILVIDNAGYTVERLIHGMNEYYNDVPQLNYVKIPDTFGAKQDDYIAFDVSTETELIDALEKTRENNDKLVLIQAHMAANDGPEPLVRTGKLIAENNSK